MSRYCGEHDVAPILEAAEHWRIVALTADASVFGDEQIWALPHLKSLNRYFVNQPDDGEGNFYEKLKSQLEPTEPEVKLLAAEMLWFMLLCPSNIGPFKKREGIETIWKWSGKKFSADSRWLNDLVLKGVGSAGTSYNTNRWREIAFFTRMMIVFKSLSLNEQERLVGDGGAFSTWLEQIPECDSRQLRHMLLFLLFPDQFERIFGGQDRRTIVEKVAGLKKVHVNHLSAREIDAKLADIRNQCQIKYKTKELDFYLSPLRELWTQTGKQTWLFAWNPENWAWPDFKAERDKTHVGQEVTQSWRTANRNVKVGDNAFLIKVGTQPKGIIATGKILSEPYEDQHWDDPEKTCWYVDISFSRIQDPAQGDPFVTENDLSQITVEQQKWLTQSSGIEIKSSSAEALQKFWHELIKTHKRLATATNLILYGPPGTGKTYQLTNYFDKYTSNSTGETKEAYLARLVADKPWWQVVGAAVMDMGKTRVPKILDHPLVQAKLAQTSIQSPSNRLWATLQSHTIQDCKYVNYQKKLEPQFFWKDLDSSWSVKEELLQELAPEITELRNNAENLPIAETVKRYEFITFHQSYGYEEFVEGIRPVMDENGEGDVQYRVEPGIFKKICQRAKNDADNEYAIFIDEINRGNISKIFGELITLVELDKRIGAVNELKVKLPYSKDEFGVPKNLSIIGTMNTADRSIAFIDIALRRRFQFMEMMPDLDLIEKEVGTIESVNIRNLLDKINRRVEFLYDRDHMVGHSYFLGCRNLAHLKTVFLQNIIPLLQEYFYGDWEKICLVLGCGTNGNGSTHANQYPLIKAEKLIDKEILGLDHVDYDDYFHYEVNKEFRDAEGEKLNHFFAGVIRGSTKSAETLED